MRGVILLDNSNNTLQNILSTAQGEFLKNGFRAASLRNIVKEAGVTTGAFYGYFKNKEELFDALVSEPAEAFLGEFMNAQVTFSNLPEAEQPQNMGKITGSCMEVLLDYIFEHFSAFKLIICCSEGTKYENFIHDIVEIEIKYTHDFMKVLKNLGNDVPDIDPQLEHILVSGMFSGLFEIVVHDIPKARAIEFARELREFYTAGWKKIMGL